MISWQWCLCCFGMGDGEGGETGRPVLIICGRSCCMGNPAQQEEGTDSHSVELSKDLNFILIICALEGVY